MKTTYYFNGKPIVRSKIPKDAKHVKSVKEEYFESKEYSDNQLQKGLEYLGKMRQLREDLDAYHG